jgi:hypothetical protein
MRRLAPLIAILAAVAAVGATGGGGQEPPPPHGHGPSDFLGSNVLATGEADRPAQGARRAVRKYLAPLLTPVSGWAAVRFRGCEPTSRVRFGINYTRCRVHVAGPTARCRAILRVRLEPEQPYQVHALRLHCRS